MHTDFFFFSIAFLVFAYIVFRVVVRRDYKTHLRLTPLSYLLEILVFAFHAHLLYLVLPTEWPNLPPLPESLLLRIVSAVPFGIGGVVLLISWLGLGTKPSLGMNRNKLKTDGLYRYSRNPQLVGYGLMLIAFAILFFSWLTLIWFLLYLIVAYFMVKSEEEYLEKKYGHEYQEYCKKVPRIV